MCDMFLEKKGKRIHAEKEKFATSMNVAKDLLDRLDLLTKRIDGFKSKDVCLVGNEDKSYCGRSNCENNIWVGAFFDKNGGYTLNVGFCVYDENQRKPKFPRKVYISAESLTFPDYNFEYEQAKDDGGYWYYVSIDGVVENTDEITKIANKMGEIINIVIKGKLMMKKCNQMKKTREWAFYIFRSIIVLLIVGLFVFTTLIFKSFYLMTFSNNLEKKATIFIIIFVLLSCVTMTYLLVIFLKDSFGIKIFKMDELFTIKQGIFDGKIEEFVDKTTETITNDEGKANKIVESERARKADLLKHYMTCITEL